MQFHLCAFMQTSIAIPNRNINLLSEEDQLKEYHNSHKLQESQQLNLQIESYHAINLVSIITASYFKSQVQ